MTTAPTPVRTAVNTPSQGGLALFTDFGSFLRFVRERAHLRPAEVVEALAQYGLNLDNVSYGRLERGRRAPRYAELQPLYQALTAGCGIVFTSAERLSFILLARTRIEGLHKNRQSISAQQWSELATNLVQFETPGRQASVSATLPHTRSIQIGERPALFKQFTQSVELLSPTLQELVLAELRVVVETVAAQPGLSLLAQMGSTTTLRGERGTHV